MNDQSQLTLFAVDSHAKTSRLQEQEKDWKVPDRVYGLNTGELLANYDQDTSSWRTSQHSLIEDLTKFSDSWPRSGMMRNGIAYQLQPLVLRTDGTDSGSWPTPTATQNGPGKDLNNPRGVQQGNALATAVLWESKGLFPTPCSRDWKDNGRSPAELARHSTTLATIAGEQLNPTWVEWLMGFPTGWTDLNNLETQLFHKSQNLSDEQ